VEDVLEVGSTLVPRHGLRSGFGGFVAFAELTTAPPWNNELSSSNIAGRCLQLTLPVNSHPDAVSIARTCPLSGLGDAGDERSSPNVTNVPTASNRLVLMLPLQARRTARTSRDGVLVSIVKSSLVKHRCAYIAMNCESIHSP